MLEVQSGTADFQAILVYDVSRWGRFQDADEGAYHEHVCSRAGIRVHYCGEQFDNDGSIGSILLKNVKRVMAGEYSRELSVKVFAGQCRLIEHGFRQGGPAGFGLRRLLIDEGRNPKGELGRGDRKSLQTDRVVLTPGPLEEIEHVQRIYSMFVEEGKSEREIAFVLNQRGSHERSRPPLDPRVDPSNSDERKIHRQQHFQSRFLQIKTTPCRQSAPTPGFERMVSSLR